MWTSLLDRIRSDDRWVRGTAVAGVCVLVTSVASIGEVQHRALMAQPSIDDVIESPAEPGTAPTSTPGARPTPGSMTAPGTTVPSETEATSGAAPVTPGSSDGTGSTPLAPDTPAPTTAVPGPTVPDQAPTTRVPDHGLVTQGVTDTTIKLGISYNATSCGDAGVLEAMVGSAATGDIDRAIEAFRRHVNDNGGVNGRELQVVIGDDGGGGCPEKALSAARYLVDDEKVFAVYPGLHDVADYVASKRVPTFVGRDDPESLRRYGANGIGLVQEIDGNLAAWSAFGEHYLDSRNHTPCIVRPESGVSGNWDLYAQLFRVHLDRHGIVMVDEVVYKDDVATAQQQASTGAARLKAKGCDQVYFMAPNPIAPIFFTQAATSAQWFPTWTFTSYMVLSDTELGGSLQDQRQWENAIGLSTRIPSGEHPREGNCRDIYRSYYPNDGQADSAAVTLACAAIIPSVEMMVRGEDLTGVLTANSMLVGADTMGDYFYDAHVPLSWRFPEGGPYTTKALRHYTVVDWDSQRKVYEFPTYPTYWEVMGPGQSNGIDLRSRF